jgi:predicted phage terminase large subunit-like protein
MEQEPGSGGKDSVKASIKNLAGFSVEADKPSGDKIYRADPLSVQVNNGNVLLVKGEWNHEFIEEFRYFPFSTYKDQVDSASGAFSKLTKKKRAGAILSNRR